MFLKKQTSKQTTQVVPKELQIMLRNPPNIKKPFKFVPNKMHQFQDFRGYLNTSITYGLLRRGSDTSRTKLMVYSPKSS